MCWRTCFDGNKQLELIQVIKFGGMPKKDEQGKKKNQKIEKYFTRRTAAEEPRAPITQPIIQNNNGKKKSCNNLIQYLSKQSPISPPSETIKLSFHNLLKEVDFKEVLERCPKVSHLMHEIAERGGMAESMVRNLIEKYFLGNQYSFWNDKYAPKNIAQLFNPEVGEQIKLWITSFFLYRNTITEESNSFSDNFQEQYSCSLKQQLDHFGWKCKALILRGRPGIGKTATIKAVSNQMKIQLDLCGNHYSHAKYLKERNESTKSQCVSVITKKSKVEKTTKPITGFLLKLDVKEKEVESKKIQIIHNVGEIYPETEAEKLYSELKKLIQSSKIPFIMTLSEQQIPKEWEKCVYDIIDMNEGSEEKVCQILWAIFHIENNFKLKKSKFIEKDKVFQQINQQLQMRQLTQFCDMKIIKDIYKLFKGRLDYIFTFLQHKLEKQKKMYNFNYFNQQSCEFLEKCCQTKLIQQIKYINKQELKEKYDLEYRYNIGADCSQTDSNESVTSENMSLRDYCKKLQMQTALDLLSPYNIQDNQFIYNKINDSQPTIEPVSYMNIPIKVHQNVKAKIVKKVNRDLALENKSSTLRTTQLIYLPILIPEKRNHRKSKNLFEDCIKKILNQNQQEYLHNFCDFIKSQENIS